MSTRHLIHDRKLLPNESSEMIRHYETMYYKKISNATYVMLNFLILMQEFFTYRRSEYKIATVISHLVSIGEEVYVYQS